MVCLVKVGAYQESMAARTVGNACSVGMAEGDLGHSDDREGAERRGVVAVREVDRGQDLVHLVAVALQRGLPPAAACAASGYLRILVYSVIYDSG